MDEIQPVEWMVLVLDATVHVNAARRAGVSLDRGARVDDPELVFVRYHLHVVTRNHGDDRENRSVRFPAFCAAARVVVGNLPLDRHPDGILGALADEGSPGEIARCGPHTLIDGWVDRDRA